MFDFHQKRKIRVILNAPLTQGVLLVLLVLVAISAFERYQIAMEMKERRVVAEQSATALEAKKADLAAEVEYLSTERGIEAEIRRQFDVALPGEQVVVIVEEEPPESVIEPLSTTPTTTPQKRWYQFWR